MSTPTLANIKIFVDDTKVKNKIEKAEDVENLQENLDKLYLWQEENSMRFNGTKFQLMRYGPNEEIKNDTLYFTDKTENIIERQSSVRDLGVILSEDAKFNDHIAKVTKTVRQKVGWILRSFYTRQLDHMEQL
jgi:hypothetical protein